jgi:hypothetical protein
LRGPEHLDAWIRQTEFLMQQLGCAAQLHDSSIAPHRVETLNAFLHRSRADTVLHILASTVGSPIYAYARVLGYNNICGKNPASLYAYLKMAAARLPLVHRGKQTAEEAAKIVSEWQHARREYYPRQVRFEGAIEWLEKMIRKRLQCGDESMADVVAVMDRMAEEKAQDSRKRSAPPAPSAAADDAAVEYIASSPAASRADSPPPAKRQATDELREVQSSIKAESETDPLVLAIRDLRNRQHASSNT